MDAKPLPPRWQSFVGAYVQNGGNGAQAAIAAGFKPHSAKHRAWSLLRNPAVQAAITEARARIRDDYHYDTERAMKDLDDAIKFSRETKNATAMCRAIELQARIAGVLSDSLSLKVNSLDLGGALIEARKRSTLGYEQTLIEQLPADLAAAVRARLNRRDAEAEYAEVIEAEEVEAATSAPTEDPFS